MTKKYSYIILSAVSLAHLLRSSVFTQRTNMHSYIKLNAIVVILSVHCLLSLSSLINI